DADTIIQRQHEDLAVADLARLRRAGRVDDGLDGRLHEGVVDGDLQLHFRQQADLELGAAVHLRVAALPPATAHVAHRHQVEVALVARGLDGLQVVRADDRNADLHKRLRAKASRACRGHSLMTTLPKCDPLSRWRRAATASAKGKTRSMTGRSWCRA